jgi:hypothetical protein
MDIFRNLLILSVTYICLYRILCVNLMKSDSLEDLDMGGCCYNGSFGNGTGGTYWIDVAQDGDKYLALVNTVKNVWLP